MKKHEAQRGQTLPLVAMSVLVLMGSAGLAVDVGYHQYRQRVQQIATDSAAMAAGQELLAGNFVKAAQQDAKTNGFTDGTANGSCTPSATTTCVQVSNPPVSPDAYAGNSGAVEVLITSPNPTFFQTVFGYTNVLVQTKAVAVLVNEPSNMCVAVLSGNANFNAGQSGGTLNAPDCGLQFNQGANFNGATVTAAAIDCSGTCSNGTFTSATPQPAAPVSDPCPAITQCAHMAGNPPTCSTQPTIPAPVNGTLTLSPGCYTSLGNITHNVSNVVFTCGLYVLKTTLDISANGNGATPYNVSQDCGTSGPGGVTFDIQAGGQLTLKNDNIDLSAPTSGDYSAYTAGEQNMMIYQDPANTNTVLFQSATCVTCTSYINGMMYAPSANLNFNASNNTTSGGSVMIVAGTLNFNGSLTNIFGAPGEGSNTIKTAVLGE